MMKRTLLVLAAAALAGIFSWGPRASGADAAAIIAQAQALSDQEKFEDANKLLLDLAKQDPDNPDVYWKIAENYYDIGERIDIEKDKDKKLSMYKQCEAWAKKGYDRNPGLADNAFWMAVGMSQQAQTNGIAMTLLSDRTLAKRIEDFYLKSSQAKDFHYRTKDADTISSAYFALGQFYRKIPDSFIVKLLMGTKGDMDKSVEDCKKAVQMYPNDIEYNKELGVSYLCRGEKNDNASDTAEGKKWLEKAMALPAENALDRIDQADSKKLIADPSLACGYGRVQQEEVSEDEFKNK
jgi:tetratricopeptide (TPR) repeat protein